MWITRRELARLERELSVARRRAEDAERRLDAERSRHDWTTLQLTSRFVVKQGVYGLDYERPEPASVSSDPRKFTQPLSVEDKAKREYYVRCFVEAGRSEEEAIDLWEREIRGEQVRYPYEEQMEREQ